MSTHEVSPSHDVSPRTAALVGNWVAAIVYGLNVALYIFSIYILRKDGVGNKRFLLVITTIHIVVTTSNICVSLAYLFQGFTQIPPESQDIYFALPSPSLRLAQLWTYFFTACIGNGIMAWRCYIVWRRSNAIAALFGVLVTAFFVCGVVNTTKLAHVTTLAQFFASYKWSTALYSLDLAVQVLSTLLIAWNIWTNAIRRSDAPTRPTSLAVIWMIIESGTVLTTASAVILTLFLLKLNAGALATPIHGQLSFFVPTSIIARAGLRRAAPTRQSQSLTGVFFNRNRGAQSTSYNPPSSTTAIPLSPSFKVSKITTVDSDAYDYNPSGSVVDITSKAEGSVFQSISALKSVHSVGMPV